MSETKWHEFVPGTICNVKMCAICDEEQEHPNHYTGIKIEDRTEETEKVLARRRAIIPGYDEALHEWLS